MPYACGCSMPFLRGGEGSCCEYGVSSRVANMGSRVANTRDGAASIASSFKGESLTSQYISIRV